MILDTSALIAVLFREREADSFIHIISATDRCSISAGNYLELSIVLERQAQPDTRRQSEMFFRRAAINVEPFSIEQAHIACQAFHDFGKTRHAAGLNFGDCFAYALAKWKNEPLLFKGDDFKKTDIVPAL